MQGEKRRRTTPVKREMITAESCDIEVKRRVLGELPILRKLSARERLSIEERFHAVGIEAGETISGLRSSGQAVFIIGAGAVRLFRLDAEARTTVLDILVPGELFGSTVAGAPRAQERYNTASPRDSGGMEDDVAVAVTNVCAFRLGDEQFRQTLAEYPAVMQWFVQELTRRVQTLHQRVQLLSTQPVEVRVAAVLLRLCEKVGKPWHNGWLIQIPLSREDLAGLAGTTGESTSRVMSGFEKSGIIESGREWVAVLDPSRLPRGNE